MAVTQLRRLVSGLPPKLPGFDTWSGHVGFVVDKMAPGQVSPSTSLSPTNFHSTNCSVLINHPIIALYSPDTESDVKQHILENEVNILSRD
jgi:hypothetical protein